MVLIYCTFPNRKAAEKVIDQILRLKLVACAHLLPSGISSYWWGRKIEKSAETVALFKTRKNLAAKTRKHLLRAHPYEVPCILSLDVQANKAYKKWLESVLNEKSKHPIA